ncbi:hypothetical protein EDB84DRAFT_1677344 [Lactarius hengduanensis]|nr:hypothetical protein EDB84DRAFT_1677344 [Lactarius hengduanensis]
MNVDELEPRLASVNPTNHHNSQYSNVEISDTLLVWLDLKPLTALGSSLQTPLLAAIAMPQTPSHSLLFFQFPGHILLQTCNSPTDILAVLRTQVQQFEESTSGDDTLTKWLNPTVNVLYALSAALGEGVGLASRIVFSPAKVIFAGAGVLLLMLLRAKMRSSISSSAIESFFRRLEEYSEVPTTEAMRDVIVKIMVEVLGIFAVVTKEMKQGRATRGPNGDCASAEVAHHVKDGVQTVGEQVKGVDDK